VTDWAAQAACRGRDPRLWFPHRGDTVSIAVAKAVCATCPVRAECLGEALAAPFDASGIWGGMTANERYELARGTAQHAS
jgi:WhiB family redox-sensing transcriptional regulator